MCKTIYRLRLFIEETSHYFPIHLYALKDKQPNFNDLLNKIENLVKDRNLNDYQIAINDTDTILCDNASLRNALKSLATDQSDLEITLCHKSKDKNNTLLGLDDLNLRRYSTPLSIDTNFSRKNTVIPIIKPTVLRWTPAILPTNIANHANNSNHHHSFRIHHVRHTSQSDDGMDCRKDSGISLDEPLRKKQRIMSADHPRKLPDPSSPSLRNNINFDHALHPLEIRRPSTAPLPSPPPTSPFRGPTLPAISSITTSSTHLDSQLAPIHTKTTNKRSRSSVSSTHHSHNIQQTTGFVCEHETNGKVCGQTFRRSYDLSRHQTIHLENRPFCYCEKCGKKFTRMDALRRHERVQGHTSSKQRSMSTSALMFRKTTSV